MTAGSAGTDGSCGSVGNDGVIGGGGVGSVTVSAVSLEAVGSTDAIGELAGRVVRPGEGEEAGGTLVPCGAGRSVSFAVGVDGRTCVGRTAVFLADGPRPARMVVAG